MTLSTDAIKKLIAEKGITKSPLIKARAGGVVWDTIAQSYETRKTWMLDIARYLSIDTAKAAAKPVYKKPVKAPLSEIAKRVLKRIAARKKLRIARRIERVPWFKIRRPTKKGWSLVYRYQVGPDSPPYQPGEYRWKQQSYFIHSNPKKPRLDMEIARARERGNPDIKRGWFKLVWLDKNADE
jgi:hypothetical protein